MWNAAARSGIEEVLANDAFPALADPPALRVSPTAAGPDPAPSLQAFTIILMTHRYNRSVRAFCLLLLLPASLLAAGHDLSTPIRYASSDLSSGVPTIAANGTHFLTLWTMGPDLYGSLADAGSVTIPPAFTLRAFVNASAVRATAAAGSGYLAVWNQNDVPYLNTLTAAGALDRSVNLDAGKLTDPRIAFNGRRILVVDRTGNFVRPATIVASLYDLTGRVISRYTLPVFGGDSYDVTNAGGQFVVVTAGSSGAHEWVIADDGTLVQTRQIEPPPVNQNLIFYSASVAWKDGHIAVVWMQFQTEVLSLAVIQPDGTVVRSTLPTGGVPPNIGMAVVPVDSGFVVAWNVGGTAVSALRVDLAGALLDANPVHVGNAGLLSAVSSENTIGFSLATYQPFSPATLLVKVDARGFTPGAAGPAAVVPVRQLLPVVTGNVGGFTAAWIERSLRESAVAVARTAHDGEPLDGAALMPAGATASSAAIAHGNAESLIVWSAYPSIVATRVTPFGANLDPSPILIAPNQYSDQLSVAWNGSRYFVIWSTGEQLLGAFVASDGSVTLPKPLGISTVRGNYMSGPDVAWDGHQFIVVFGEVSQSGVTCGPCPEPIPEYIRVLRVSPNGDALDVIPQRIPGHHIRAHVASSGAESLIALDSYDSEVSTVTVHDDDGVLHVDSAIPLFSWPISTVSSDVTWAGSNYIVSWEYLDTLSEPHGGWLAAARLTRSGSRVESLVTPVGSPESISYSHAWGPSIAANDAGETALVIAETRPQSSLTRARLYLVTELGPMPAAPPAPHNAVSLFGGKTARIEWQADDVPGFLIEWSYDFGNTWRTYTVVSGTTRSITLLASIGNLFRIRAFGPGGLSDGPVTSIGSTQRRRAERH